MVSALGFTRFYSDTIQLLLQHKQSGMQPKSRPLGKIKHRGPGSLHTRGSAIASDIKNFPRRHSTARQNSWHSLPAPLSASAHLCNLEATSQRAGNTSHQHRISRHGISRESHCPVLTSLKWQDTMRTTWAGFWFDRIWQDFAADDYLVLDARSIFSFGWMAIQLFQRRQLSDIRRDRERRSH